MLEKLWKRLNKPCKSEGHLQQLKQSIKTDDHLVALEELCKRHRSNLATGLDPDEVKRRQEKFGLNRLSPPLTVPKWIKFGSHIFEGFSTLLWIGAILLLGTYLIERKNIDNLYLGIVLIFVVICSGVFSYMQEAKSDAIMDSFNKLIPQTATAIRCGKKCEINAEQLVVGDVVEFKAGEIVPADVRVSNVLGCKVDNSSLTGESDPQSRVPSESNKIYFESRNMAFFSTNCVEGWARGLVVAIGDDTAMGRIAVLTSNLEQDDTPLAKEISHFVHLLTIVSIVMGVFVLLISLMMGTGLIDSTMFFISMVVSNVPEGLLATVTVCLTLTAKRMASKNCLVKNLQAVETLGSTSTICSDKTGTLTQNRMTVSHLWVSRQTLNAGDIEPSHISLSRTGPPKNAFEITALICCLCSKAEFKFDQEKIPIDKRLTIGDASESAILKFMEATLVCNTGVMAIRAAYPKAAEISFNSTNKYHLTIHRVDWQHCSFIICLKGAPERILSRCAFFVTDEKVSPLDEDLKKDYHQAYSFLGGKGERVLGMAWLALPKQQFPAEYIFDTEKLNFPIEGLHFVGLISMIDPPRPGVADAVEKCRSAGIKVVMVTGDHPITAKAIAKKVNIISRDSKVFHSSESTGTGTCETSIRLAESECSAIVVTGAELTDLQEGGLDQVIANFKEIVFARTSPQQKLLIVEAFQRKGEIVAVTGDGVNDSPALKKADIGIAMGISGSDVSKQAADMILLDDNFASIVVGVEEGRIIFDNLKKSIAYTLTSNIPEMFPFLMYLIFSIPLGLGTITILCVDLGTDIIPAISLAYEPAESDIMMRKPRTANDRLVNHRMIQTTYMYVGIISTAAGFIAYFVIMAEHGFFWTELKGIRNKWESKGCDDVTDHYGQEWNYAARKRLEYTCQTAFFIAIVVTQYFDLIICKTRRNSILHQGMTNEVLNFALITETCLAIFLCYCPGMLQVLKLFPLKWMWWTFGLPYGLGLFILDELRRYQIRKYPGCFLERESYY